MAPNLDKHPTQKGVYIAYDAQGFAFRVRKSDAWNMWMAKPSHAGAASDTRSFSAGKLRDVAEKVGKSSRQELPADESGIRNFK